MNRIIYSCHKILPENDVTQQDNHHNCTKWHTALFTPYRNDIVSLIKRNHKGIIKNHETTTRKEWMTTTKQKTDIKRWNKRDSGRVGSWEIREGALVSRDFDHEFRENLKLQVFMDFMWYQFVSKDDAKQCYDATKLWLYSLLLLLTRSRSTIVLWHHRIVQFFWRQTNIGIS